MNLICPFAVQRPGPAVKVWPEQNVVAGIVEHDAGAGTLEGAFSDLDDVTLVQDAQGEWVWRSPKSWQFTIAADENPDGFATIYQHYPLTASCWHTGVHAYNTRQIGVEHIRPDHVNPTVLSGAQLASSVRLAQWIAMERGWPQGLVRDVPPGSDQRTLWQHGELNATPCPNGRIPWDAYLWTPPTPIVPPLSQQELIEAMAVTYWGVPAGAYQRRYEIGPGVPDSGGRNYTIRVQP